MIQHRSRRKLSLARSLSTRPHSRRSVKESGESEIAKRAALPPGTLPLPAERTVTPDPINPRIHLSTFLGEAFSASSPVARNCPSKAAPLFLGNSTSSTETTILWSNGQSGHQCVSNHLSNVNPDGWVTSAATTSNPEATLDAAFPRNGLGGWVIATAVPEPSTWVMALGGVAAFFWRQSRRSRRSHL